MRLTTKDPNIDAADIDERTARWEVVKDGMKLGLITPENMTQEERTAVREFLEDVPIIRPYDRDDVRHGAEAEVIGIANLVEGREWCFATTRDGTFGVFSLDEPSRTFLYDAVFHLWVPDDDNPQRERRMDFIDLCDYLTVALEAMQLAA